MGSFPRFPIVGIALPDFSGNRSYLSGGTVCTDSTADANVIGLRPAHRSADATDGCWAQYVLPDLENVAPLTARELEVIELVADGASAPAIAQELVLSNATVRTHLRNIYSKLDVSDRAAAVAKAMRLGLI